MKLYIRSNRSGQIIYTSCDGMAESLIRTLMEEIGHTDIEVITEQEYTDNLPAF